MSRFEQICRNAVMVAADSVAELRPIDIERVLDQFAEFEALDAGAAWLRDQVCDHPACDRIRAIIDRRTAEHNETLTRLYK